MDFIVERAKEYVSDEVLPKASGDTQSDAELKSLLKSLQPKIRVFGCGGCGSNTVARLELEGLFDGTYVKGLAVTTDAQHLLRVTVENKVLIGRSARGRGAGGDPETRAQAAYESEPTLHPAVDDSDLAFIIAGVGGGIGT